MIRPMSLSVCLLTTAPAPRLSAMLEPLRAYADEVLIAADARTDDRTLAGYAGLADRLFRIDFRSCERHLGWLYQQCDSDWILRLGEDELTGVALARQLPEMMESRQVQQFYFARRWLWRDGTHYLAEQPWSTDFVSRLVRNGGVLRTRESANGRAENPVPGEYVSAPIYNFELLFDSYQQRRDKVIREEIEHHGLWTADERRLCKSLRLPELYKPTRLLAVPEEDRALIASVISSSGVIRRSSAAGPSPLVSLEEMDRMWDGRSVHPDAYRATLQPYESEMSLAPSERRTVFFEVTNEGTERWPATLEQAPQLRLGHRWLNADGTLHSETGPRTPFPRPVSPGERVLSPIDAQAPAQPGEYLLEVDVVHEHVRWFDRAGRMPVHVTPSHSLFDDVVRIRETRPPTRRRWRKMRIPRTIHRVWLGEKPMSESERRYGETFAHHHPRWTMRLWTEEDLSSLEIDRDDIERARSPSELSNLVRYEVMHRFGGIYVDTDFECLRPLTPILRGVEAFTALESPGRAAVGIL